MGRRGNLRVIQLYIKSYSQGEFIQAFPLRRGNLQCQLTFIYIARFASIVGDYRHSTLLGSDIYIYIRGQFENRQYICMLEVPQARLVHDEGLIEL